METSELERRLDAGEIVPLNRGEWEALAPLYRVRERHDTRLAGELLVIETPSGLAAVESPSRDERVVRPLADERAAREHVESRLADYERMWDGCGCKVEYYR